MLIVSYRTLPSATSKLYSTSGVLLFGGAGARSWFLYAGHNGQWFVSILTSLAPLAALMCPSIPYSGSRRFPPIRPPSPPPALPSGWQKTRDETGRGMGSKARSMACRVKREREAFSLRSVRPLRPSVVRSSLTHQSAGQPAGRVLPLVRNAALWPPREGRRRRTQRLLIIY